MFIEGRVARGHNPRRMDGRIDPPEIIGPRLKALRYALGFPKSQSGFAAMCGIAPKTWNNYEKLKRIPSREEAAKIRDKAGVTLDFIFHGDMGGLTVDKAAKIRAAEAALAADDQSEPIARGRNGKTAARR